MSFEYIRNFYDVPAERGRRVLTTGGPGIISHAEGPYICVLLDCDKPNNINPYHPKSVKYLEMGTIRKMTRSQARYQNYLKHGDLYENFAQYLGIKE